MHLLGTAGGPLGGDQLSMDVRVTAGTHATLRSVAATILLPGDGRPSHHHVDVVVEPGATLQWLPEPLVAADGCDHRASATIHLAPDAALIWTDEVILGRTGEHPGRFASDLRIVRDGTPVIHHAFDTTRPGWAGPAVTANRRAIGLVAIIGRPATQVIPRVTEDGTISHLSPDVAVAVCLAPDAHTLHRHVDAVVASAQTDGPRGRPDTCTERNRP